MIKRIMASLILCLAGASVFFSLFLREDEAYGMSARRRVQTKGLTVLLDESVPTSPTMTKNKAYQIANQINSIREAYGLNDLAWSEDLAAAAEIRATECNTSWSHDRPDGSPWYTVNPAIMGGENLSKGYDAEQVVFAWMDSPAHKENILWSEFRYIGLSEDNGYIACEFAY